MDFLRVKNFSDFQHYKDRNPPWIRLYNHLLDDYEFSCLQDASKLHLILIWLVASRTSNKIPHDTAWISRKINASQIVDLEVLISAGFLEKIEGKQELPDMEHNASTPLAPRLQDACLEQSRAEQSRERKQARKKTRASSRFSRPSVEDVRAYCDERGNSIDPQAFVDFYESKGWKVGSSAMKSWKAAVRTWEAKQTPKTAQNDYMGGV